LNLKRFKETLSKKLKTHNIILVTLIITGAILRINGLDYGLPLRFHPDEGVIINPALRIATSGDLDPRVYYRPNHISVYLNALSFKFYSLVRSFLFDIRGSVQRQFNEHPDPYVYLSRLITASLGTLMILSMFFLGKEVGGKRVGLLSSSFTAFFPSFIQHSHYATADIPLVFFISMVALYVCKYMKRKKIIFLLLGCLFCGLASAEKYPGVLSTTMIILGIVFSHWQRKASILKIGVISFIAYFSSIFVAAPFLFINYKRVLQGIAFEMYTYHLGASGLGWHGNLLYYLNVLRENMGMLLWTFFLMGIFLFIIKFKKYLKIKHYLSISLFGLIYFVLLFIAALHWESWALPMYIIPIVIASVGVNSLSMFLRRKTSQMNSILFILLVILISSLFFRGLSQSINFSMPDTRTVSKQWISENLPNKARIVADAYTPIKPGCCGSVAEKSLEEFKKDGIDYVVVSSFMYERILKEKDRYPREVDFYTKLFEKEKLVKSFSATSIDLGNNDLITIYRGIRELIKYLQQKEIYLRGPEIEIYKISTDNF